MRDTRVTTGSAQVGDITQRMSKLKMNPRTSLSSPASIAVHKYLTWAWVWACVWAWVVCGTGGECPKVCECKWRDGKETVSCPKAEFIDIPRRLDPSTQVLDLQYNNLQILPRDAFVDVGLVNLQKVWLNFCNLKHLDEGAFNKLANLVELDLSNNALRLVPSAALSDVPGLRELRLAYNSLTSLPEAAFTPTPDLVRLDISHNSIGAVNERAFRGLTRLEVLKLTANKFKTLYVSVVLPLVAIHELHLDKNPWHCDCSLRPLREWMVVRNVAFSEPPSCNLPARLKGHHWQTLTIDEFVCVPKVTAVAPRVLAAHGENVSLSCRVETDIDAAITWFVGERPIQNASESQRYRVLELIAPNQEIRLSNLTIAGAAPQDQGTYRCVVKNKAGSVETNLTLQVSNEIAEVRLVTMDRVFVTGGLLTAVAVIVVFLLLLLAIVFRRRQRSRRRGIENIHKAETPQSSQAHGSNTSDSHPKLSDYHIVPTSDMDEPSPLPTHTDKSWMLRDTSVDDFPSTKDLEKPALYSDTEKQRLQKPIQDRSVKQTSPSTVSYVEIPKSELAPQQDSSDDRLRWAEQACNSKDNLLHQGCSGTGSQLSMSSSGHYPDLLDLPYTQQVHHDQSSLQLLNPAYCTIPRNRSAFNGGSPPRPPTGAAATVEDHQYRDTTFTLPTTDRYRSASALNLAMSDGGSGGAYNGSSSHPQVRHQHSLPEASPPPLLPHQNALRNLMAAHRAKYQGVAGAAAAGGGGSRDEGEHEDEADPCRFEYHAQQLENFLREYRNLQEQLYRMKESYEAHHRAGSLSRIDTILEDGGGGLAAEAVLGEVDQQGHEDPPPPAEPSFPSNDPVLSQGSLLASTEPLRSILKKRYEEELRSLRVPYSGGAYFSGDSFGLPRQQYPDHDS